MSDTHLLHIALITCDDIFEAGGVGTSIVRIARGLSTRYNMQVDILMLNSSNRAEFNPHGRNGIIQLDQRIEDVTLFKLASWTGGTSQAQRWVDMHYALLELAQERQYDLMQAFYASITGFPAVYAAHELNIPSIVSIRGNDIIEDVFNTERFPYLKWALENATQFTAVSQEGLNRARILSARPTKGRVILNSIRPQDFAEGTQDLQLPRPVIGSLAVFKNKKGLEVLLCAFNMLLQRYPTAHLLLAGFVIPEAQDRFERFITKYNLEHDGCPNTVLEAMLAGIPIVATRSGAVPELIEDGKHGLLVRPGSATELCEAMASMLNTGTDRYRYGEQARERVLTRFAPQRELAEYREVYQECLMM